jgi:hypothetical protein
VRSKKPDASEGSNLLILCGRNDRVVRSEKKLVLGTLGALVADQQVLAEIESRRVQFNNQ